MPGVVAEMLMLGISTAIAFHWMHWDLTVNIFLYKLFLDLWYMSRQSPSHNGGGERGKIPKTLYDVNNHYLHILRGANKCMFGRTNRPEYCAKEFVLKRLPGGRLNAISDVETIIRKWTGDNQWNQYY